MKRQDAYLWFWVGCVSIWTYTAASLWADSNHPTRAQADELYARGRYADAAALYERLSTSTDTNRENAAYALLQLGMCQLKEKHLNAATVVWARLQLLYPTSPYVPQALLVESGNAPNAVRTQNLQEEILTKYSNSTEAANILIQRGEAAFARQDYVAANTIWQTMLERFPKHPRWAEIRRKADAAVLSAKGDQELAQKEAAPQALAEADTLFNRAMFKEAARLYQRFIEQFPAVEQTSYAAGRLAQCQLALDRPGEALATLQRMAEHTPTGGAKVLSELVVHYAGQHPVDKIRDAATQLLLAHYPETFEAQQTLFIAGSVQWSRKNQEEAKKWWDLLLQRYPKTDFRAAIEKEEGRTEGLPIATTTDSKKSKKLTSEEQAAEREQRRKEELITAQRLEIQWRLAGTNVDERVAMAYELARTDAVLGRMMPLCKCTGGFGSKHRRALTPMQQSSKPVKIVCGTRTRREPGNISIT